MPVCQFGERQYELAANLEMLAGGGQFFVPTLPQEKDIGIDIALTPGNPQIWSLLKVKPPPGVRLGPGAVPTWPPNLPTAASPPFLISLFLQYKRSTFLTRKNAKEWSHHGEPYWRIVLTPHQHKLLRELELRVGDKAVVRYAAPRFWQYQELWLFQSMGAILDQSMFVSPEEALSHHSRLTWSPTHGLQGHSTPERLPDERSTELSRAVIAKAASSLDADKREDARTHIRTLARALEALDPGKPRRKRLQEVRVERNEIYDALDDETVEVAIDMAIIMDTAASVNADWLLIGLTKRI